MNDSHEQVFMYDWYTDFYRAAPLSQAHKVYCERVYGRDLCQHGYTTMQQLDDLLAHARLTSQSRVLDVGCGNGMIAEYISQITGAHVHGIDYIAEAIEQAQARTVGKHNRLTFQVGNMNTLELTPGAFDTILALDTLYFGELDALIQRLLVALKPGGQLLTFYNLILWNENDDRETLLPDRTPLAQVLTHLGLAFEAWDYTHAEYERSRLSLQAANALKAAFAAEVNLFLYENRRIEAEGNLHFYEGGRTSRFLYHVRL